jgi:hypothetical protein
MGKSVGSDDVDETSVDELLGSHSSVLNNKDLLEVENNMNDESQEPFFAESIKQLSTKQMTEVFKHMDSAIRITGKNYPNGTRSAKVEREIQNSLARYKEFYRERNNASLQLSLDCFI